MEGTDQVDSNLVAALKSSQWLGENNNEQKLEEPH